MAKACITVTIFISSPSDLDDEINFVYEVIANFNREQKKIGGDFRFEISHYKKNMPSSFRSTPQDLVNQELVECADIYIGMLYKRIGTATTSYPSGTIEEFNVALKGFNEKNLPSHVGFLFKNGPVELHSLDIDSLQQIFSFKKSLSSLGLYHEFKEKNELRNHVESILIDYISNYNQTPVSLPSPQLMEEKIFHANEELGLLEFDDAIAENFEVLTELIEYFTEEMMGFGEKITEQSVKMTAVTSSGNRGGAKQVCTETANIMLNFVANNAHVLVGIKKHFKIGLNNLGEYLKCFDDSYVDVNLRAGVPALRKNIISSNDMMKSFSSVIKSLPRLTGDFNKAKIELSEFTEEFVNEFSLAVDKLHDIEESHSMFIADNTNVEMLQENVV